MESLDLSTYDVLAAKHNAAYAAFRAIYETRLPPPPEPKFQRESVFVPVALVVMIIASVFISGSRTVLEFGGGLAGIAAVAMLEGAIISYAFFRTRLNFNDERMEAVRVLANRGLALAFVVAVAANVHSVIKGAGIETPPVITISILLLVAVSAPTLAFISGDIMALELMRNGYKERKLQAAYQESLTAWAEGLNEAWGREKSRWGVNVKIEAAPVSIPTLSNGIPLESNENQPSKSTLGHTKQPDATPIVEAYFIANPDMLSNGKPLEIARELGVGKSTVYTVRAKMLQDNQK